MFEEDRELGGRVHGGGWGTESKSLQKQTVTVTKIVSPNESHFNNGFSVRANIRTGLF